MNAGQTGSLRRTAELVLLASILLLAPLEVLAQVGGGYAGPSLLSRGGNTPGRRGNAPVNFTYYGALRGMYESGLIAPVLDERGNLNGVTLQGVQAELGAYGARAGGGQVSASTIVAITVRLALTYGPTTVPIRRCPLTTLISPRRECRSLFAKRAALRIARLGGSPPPHL